jgi:hypothetical protein
VPHPLLSKGADFDFAYLLFLFRSRNINLNQPLSGAGAAPFAV